MKNYKGVIIEESLADASVLNKVKILSTKIEPVTDEHKTPWIKQWTMHDVEIEADKAEEIAEIISKSLDTTHSAWYADFKNEAIHYVIYANKIFNIHRDKKEEYRSATDYGISIGIPDYQVDFSDYIQKWERETQ
ncbi:MAG: hypothetical protein EXS47_02455 [Candidatus Zambryskibacteria bacterium]|nr:hypothetical protein [Candidatus Zambryskibacteria bacterium]